MKSVIDYSPYGTKKETHARLEISYQHVSTLVGLGSVVIFSHYAQHTNEIMFMAPTELK